MATGGAQRVLLDQAGWFTQHGWRVTAAFLYDKEGLEERWRAAMPCKLVNLRARKPEAGNLANLFLLAGGLWRLISLLRHERFNTIETFTHHSNLIGLPLAWLTGVPVRVATHHGHILGVSQTLERMHARMVNCGLATCLVAVSERVKVEAEGEGVRSEKIMVIPNGIAIPEPGDGTRQRTREELRLAEDTTLILTAGRMTRQKAHTYLLQAAPSVLARHPNTVFALAGAGELRSELEAEAAALGIASAVRFLGIRQDMPHLLAAADIFALPSRWEGLPMVLLEAMGAGLAVVATSVEGVEDVIQDGENGLLVPSEDALALSGALLRLLDEPALRSRLALAARATVKSKYTLDNACKQYAAILNPNARERNE